MGKGSFATLISVSLLFFLSTILNWNCGPHEPGSVNNPPHVPNNPTPPDSARDVDVDIDLMWISGDPDAGDVVTYDIYLQANETNPGLVDSNRVVNLYHPDSLAFSTRYYWRIVAKDNQGATSTGPVWNFITRPEHDNPPYAPNNPSPPDGATEVDIVNVILQWSGGDPDTFDVVTYDVFFGANRDSLPLIASDHPDTSYPLETLAYETEYYWKINSKDLYGEQTEGPLWSFTTKARIIHFSENFDDDPTGGHPSSPQPWNWVTREVGDATVSISEDVYYGLSGKSCRFQDPSDSGWCYIATYLPQQSSGVVEFAWRITSEEDYFGARIYQDSTKEEKYLGPYIAFRKDTLQYYNQLGRWQPICAVTTQNWYRMKLVFNCDQGYYDIFVNEELKVTQATWFGNSVTALNLIYFMTFKDKRSTAAYLDEILFYTGSQAQGFTIEKPLSPRTPPEMKNISFPVSKAR